MGLFDGGQSYSSSERLGPPRTSHAHPHARGASPSRSTSGGYYVRSSNSRSASDSFFGGGNSRGIFGSSSGKSSYYKRSPREGYIKYLMQKLQRMVKELWYYARKNPVKAFFAVVVPLLSAGGAVHGLLKQFGVRLPFGMGASTSRYGGGYYGSTGYGGGRSGGAGGWMDNAGGLMQIAKAFM